MKCNQFKTNDIIKTDKQRLISNERKKKIKKEIYNNQNGIVLLIIIILKIKFI